MSAKKYRVRLTKKQRKELKQNVQHLISGLKNTGYKISSDSQIIPIIIGKEKEAMEFGKYLFDNGVFAQPIRFPTVPHNKARIRLSVTAWLSKNQIEQTIGVFEKAAKKFKI